MYYVCVTMKTKPISIRFDEQNLLLAQNLSGVKKPQKLVDLLISEYVKPLKGAAIELPKDYMNFKNIGILKEDGSVEKLKFAKPEKKESKSWIGKLESNIDYKPVSKESYDSEKINFYLSDEAGQWPTPTYDNSEIQKQIDALKKEIENVPKTHSPIGKKTWVFDRQKKIDELQKLKI